MAKEWPALKNWNSTSDGKDYLKELFGKEDLNVYYDGKSFSKVVITRQFSFNQEDKKDMSYERFIEKQSQTPQDYNLKITNRMTLSKVMKDIVSPKFYDNIADIKEMTLYQGANFYERPMYERQE